MSNPKKRKHSSLDEESLELPTDLRIVKDRLDLLIENDRPTMAKVLTMAVDDNLKKQFLMMYYKWKETDDSTLEDGLTAALLKSRESDLNKIYQQINEEIEEESEEEDGDEDDEDPPPRKTVKMEKSNQLLKDLQRLENLETTPEIRSLIKEKLVRYHQAVAHSRPDDSELRHQAEWLDYVLKLPYSRVKHSLDASSGVEAFLRKVRGTLDKELFGLNKVKDRLLEVVASRVMNPGTGFIPLALKGPPGVGKTSIAKALANALHLPFETISCSGVQEVTLFKGERASWVGSGPSAILKILCRLGYSNPIIYLDEIDKIGETHRGRECYNALLPILDAGQNKAVSDIFISEFTHDLSRVWFIMSMNSDHGMDKPLLDRLNVVEVQNYTADERRQIVRNYLWPKKMSELRVNDLTLSEAAVACLVRLCKESIRDLGKRIEDLLLKINYLRLSGGVWKTKKIVESEDVEQLVGAVDSTVRPTHNMYI